MGKFYLIRHAESIANSLGIYQGQTHDTELSLRGKKQAKSLAKYFRNKNIDFIIASPLKRTKITAGAISLVTGAKIIFETSVLETNHGKWEGKHKDVIERKWKSVFKKWQKSPGDTSFPDGESFKKTQERVIEWWSSFKNTPGEFAVVTHDNIIRIIIADVLGLKLNKIWNFHITPTGVTAIENTEGNLRLVTLNDTKHLEKVDMGISTHAL